MSWVARPNPGDMTICRACPHRRDDERKDYRCKQTYHQPFLPPLVSYGDGRGQCSFWPPPQETETGQLPLLAEQEQVA